MNIQYKRKGMTLMEVIVAMAIFGIIAVAFLTMFTSSLLWTFRAGDRGIAYTQALSKLENRISLEEPLPDYLNLTFENGVNDIDISIRGRIIEEEDTENQISSELSTFVPLMPRIALAPTFRFEGDINSVVQVKGYDTNFNGTTKVDFYDFLDNDLLSGNITPSVSNATELQFELPLNLLNREYLVVVTTRITGEPDEIARTKYIVDQPKFIILGETEAYVSADGKNWRNRTSTTDWFDYESTDAMFNSYVGTSTKSISSDGKDYVISENNLMLSNFNSIWSVDFETGINEVNWLSQYSKYYAATDNGIYFSTDRDTWSHEYYNTKLNSITRGIKDTITQVIASAGDDGVIVFFDGIYWNNYIVDSEVDFKSVSINENGVITALGIKTTDEGTKSVIWKAGYDLTWSQSYESADTLNDLYYSPAIAEFIAVGDSGKIITSPDGNAWQDLSPSLSVESNLNGVFSNLSQIVIVGDNGEIIYYGIDGGWQVITGTAITEDLLHVSGK